MSDKNNQGQFNKINIDKEILLKKYEFNMSDHDRKKYKREQPPEYIKYLIILL